MEWEAKVSGWQARRRRVLSAHVSEMEWNSEAVLTCMKIRNQAGGETRREGDQGTYKSRREVGVSGL